MRKAGSKAQKATDAETLGGDGRAFEDDSDADDDDFLVRQSRPRTRFPNPRAWTTPGVRVKATWIGSSIAVWSWKFAERSRA
jgi:hypothetical protein